MEKKSLVMLPEDGAYSAEVVSNGRSFHT